jgi:hypothetical protein
LSAAYFHELRMALEETLLDSPSRCSLRLGEMGAKIVNGAGLGAGGTLQAFEPAEQTLLLILDRTQLEIGFG